ncbi:MAG: mechanosensitive ion channel family protein [Gammaproteobacteria bacterium]
MDSSIAAHTVWVLTRLAIVLAATLAGWFILAEILRRIARALHVELGQRMVRRYRFPLALLLPALAGLSSLSAFPSLSPALESALRHSLEVLLIAGCAWFLRGIVRVGGDTIMARHPTDALDNYRARSLRTQVTVIERIATILAVILGIAAALMTFPQVRAIGTSLLASAGLAGIVLGLAARPVLENLLAGLQIALSRPINLDDVVVIDGYWGRIEEITATYVVLAVWDERRLIMPFSRIISSSVENWTRRHSELLGTVYFYTDYNVPIDELRAELDRICHASKNWDGRLCSILVTDATEHTLQLRALVSTADSNTEWNLRCEVREGLIKYLRIHHPESLPRTRFIREGEEPAPSRPSPEA